MWHLWGKKGRRKDTENLGVVWNVIIKLNLKKCNEMVWCGFIWHTISKNGGLSKRGMKNRVS